MNHGRPLSRRTIGTALLLALLGSGAAIAANDNGGAPEPAPTIGVAEAVVLGVVEGVTEFLPISSTGHLILTERALGIGAAGGEDKEAADAFVICIQAGAILAVLGLYRRRATQALRGVLGRDDEGRRLAFNLLAAFFPAAVVGLTLNEPIKEHLFGLWPVVIAWGVGGVAILGIEAWRTRRQDVAETQTPSSDGKPLEALALGAALTIGLFQCLAVWPGVSRSLVTIVGGLVVGLSLPAAVEFSFLLGVVTLGAATAYDMLKHGERMLESYGLAPLLIGTLAAMLSAAVAVKWMVGYLNRHGLAVFGYYRIALAAIVAVLLLMEALKP